MLSSSPRPLFKVPSHNSQRPANIPLRELDADHARLLDNPHRRSDDSDRDSFDTPGSDSSWGDIGDLRTEDPLRDRLRESLEGIRPPKKHARFQSPDPHDEKAGQLRKEDIPIPDPGPRTISRAERILAAIMAPRDGPSRIHGLHGKKLM